MKVAIIVGITGQDGSYMAELLVGKGYEVMGVVRNSQKAEQSLPDFLRGQVKLLEWDMCDSKTIVEILSRSRPSEIYNFAAYSSGSGMFDDSIGIGEVNGLAITRILEAMREVDATIRFCQASSSEMFGEVDESPQSESSA